MAEMIGGVTCSFPWGRSGWVALGESQDGFEVRWGLMTIDGVRNSSYFTAQPVYLGLSLGCILRGGDVSRHHSMSHGFRVESSLS